MDQLDMDLRRCSVSSTEKGGTGVEEHENKKDKNMEQTAPSDRFQHYTYNPRTFKVGDKVYTMNRCLKQPWRVGEIQKIYIMFKQTMLDLKFIDQGEKYNTKHTRKSNKRVNAKHIAYYKRPKLEWIHVSQRVIARLEGARAYFVGIVAETPSALNKDRVLVFFDDGYAAYCPLENIRMVTTNGLVKGKPWLQVHPDSQKFIEKYLKEYPYNPKATLRLGSLTTIEWHGRWWTARVINNDCSMVEVQLISNDLRHIIWRGSQRFYQIYKQQLSCQPETVIRPSKDILGEYEGRVRYHKLPDSVKTRPSPRHIPHACSRHCWKAYPNKLEDLRKLSPLIIPMYHGWKRKIFEAKDLLPKSVWYEAPCGQLFSNLEQVQNFITKANYEIGIDSFNFSMAIDCFAEFEPAQSYFQPGHYYCEDISEGKEWVPISKVNTVNTEQPTPVEYVNKFRISSNVRRVFSTDPDRMVCCDCTDNCEDKQKCECFRLTLQDNPKFVDGTLPDSESGYSHRRLLKVVSSGIYECNKGCKCRRATCINRVAQNGVKCKIEVFYTSSKGYAVRAMQDIPRGTFICLYIGEVLDHEEGRDIGERLGSEYLADLDFLECSDDHKPGYEETAIEPDAVRFAGFPRAEIERFKQEMKGLSKTRLLFGLTGNKMYQVDGKRVGNVGRYFSHSCNPNLEGQYVFLSTHDIRFAWLGLFTVRDIKCGTELTWDYSYLKAMPTEKRPLICTCGGLGCKKALVGG